VARVDICVITCRRPKGLRRLLGALQQLHTSERAAAVRVVVVDNDADESARAVCSEAAEWLQWPLHYATEKRRGIPQARNTALALALPHADFVAFIDDDETPDPDWLEALLRTLAAHDGDAVTGPALPAFEIPPARWVVESRLFDGPRHATGTSVSCAYTNNVLVRTRALAALDALFDETLALTGSSDWEFFTRFASEGHRIVWCDEAHTHEWIPATRARLGWLLRRALRTGSTQSVCERRAAAPVARLRIAAHGAWCIARGLASALLGLPRGRGAAARGLALATAGVGRLAGLSGWAYREYRTIHGS
jgi:glycosyltransferase involved in cell wall biosynthesis